jgi:mannose-6-phosphate isomerase-like protein (cupin superfamily)
MPAPLSRRTFVQSTGLAALAQLFAITPTAARGGDPRLPDPDLVRDPDEGEVYLIGERRGRVTIKVSKRDHGIETLSLLTEDIVPGDGIPVHKHGGEEELIFIERGRGVLTFGDEEVDVVPGSMALVPRGVWHGLRNEDDDLLRMVFGYTPAGFEDYFRAIGVRPDEPWKGLTGADWARINAEFEVVYRD